MCVKWYIKAKETKIDISKLKILVRKYCSFCLTCAEEIQLQFQPALKCSLVYKIQRKINPGPCRNYGVLAEIQRLVNAACRGPSELSAFGLLLQNCFFRASAEATEPRHAGTVCSSRSHSTVHKHKARNLK